MCRARATSTLLRVFDDAWWLAFEAYARTVAAEVRRLRHVVDVTTTKLDLDSTERMTMLGEELGLSSLGLRQIALRPGQRNRVHRHRDQEEAYLVLCGTLTILLEDGASQELGVGELARIAPAARRQLANRGDEPCVILAIGAAGVHERADAEAFHDWTDTDPKSPQDVPLPE